MAAKTMLSEGLARDTGRMLGVDDGDFAVDGAITALTLTETGAGATSSWAALRLATGSYWLVSVAGVIVLDGFEVLRPLCFSSAPALFGNRVEAAGQMRLCCQPGRGGPFGNRRLFMDGSYPAYGSVPDQRPLCAASTAA